MAREDGKGLPMVSYWGIWDEGPESVIPPGMIGGQAVGCGNPNCSTGCPSVGIGFTQGGNMIHLRMEPGAARELAAILLTAANEAEPSMKRSAN